MDLLSFLKSNFFHVAPILAVGAIALLIIVDRSKALLLSYPLQNQAKFFDSIKDLVLGDRVADAIAVCDHHKSEVVPSVVREALLRAHQPEETIEDGLDLAANRAVQKVMARTAFLSSIANIATLLGLFGTIVGLIHSFEAVGQVNAQQRSTLLAAGISTAMNATMLGLAVAIPCMAAFSFFMNRSNRLVAQIEESAVMIMDLLRQRYTSGDNDGGSSNDQTKAG